MFNMVLHIEDIAQQALAQLGLEDVSIYRISDPGTSQSRVFLYCVPDGRLIAVKILASTSMARVTLKKELANRKKLEKYLGDKLAEIYWYGVIDGFEVIVYEAVGANSLHGEILQGTLSHQQITATWLDFLSHLTAMWNASATKPPHASPRPYDARFERIKDGLSAYFRDTFSEQALALKTIINGKEYASISELLDALSRAPSQTISVTCHGDPQPSNIVVNPATGDWKLVDWEWSQEGHDWRMMSAHLYGWWLTRTVRFAEQPSMTVKADGIYLDYQTYEDTHNDTMKRITLEHLLRAMKPDTAHDIPALRQYLALLLLGEVRFAHLWGREAHIPYYLAMAHQILESELSLQETRASRAAGAL